MDINVQHSDDNQEFRGSTSCFREVSVRGKESSSAKFLAWIGIYELFSAEMWRAAMAELVATACLLYSLTTTIISCSESNVSEPKLLIPIAVFVVAFLLLMVAVPFSGGHMNPIFTFIAALKGAVTLVRAVFYILAQCLGSLLAYIVMKNMMNHKTAEKYYLGGCIINRDGTGVTAETALMVEFSCTFLMLFVAISLAFDKARFNELGLTMVCVIVAAVYALVVYISLTVTEKAGYSGAGLNPARCLGPALLLGGPLWDGFWVFWVGPFSACIMYHVTTLALPREGFLKAAEKPNETLPGKTEGDHIA